MGLKIKKENYTYSILILILLSMYAVFPGNFNAAKLGLTIFISFVNILYIFTTKRIENIGILLGIFSFVLISFFQIYISVLNNFSVPQSIIETYILRPILILIIVDYIKKKISFDRFNMIILIVSFILIIYNLIYFLGAFGLIPQVFTWEQENTVIATDNFLTARLTNQASLTFFLPYVFILKLTSNRFTKNNLVKINFYLGIIVALISGRRILQIICIITILIAIILATKRNINKIVQNIIILFLVILTLIFINYIVYVYKNIDVIEIISATISDAFNQNSYSYQLRDNQLDILLSQWKLHPIIGTGISSYVPYYVRDFSAPWSYEFVYVAYLFQIGIVGVLIYTAYILNIMKRIYNNSSASNNKYIYLAIIVSSFSFFIAGATNPMIASVWFWLIFLSIYCFSFDETSDF